MTIDVFDKLEQNWGCPVVARSQIARFSGGLLTPKTLANLDSLGKGPEGRLVVGRRVGYDVHTLVEWMRERATGNTWGAIQERLNAES